MLRRWSAVFVVGLSVLMLGCTTPTQPLPSEDRVHVVPSWSNDGSTIAFSATIQGVAGIYLVDSTGANVRLLHSGNAAGCSWSPDSRWLVFAENGSLYRMRNNGDSLTQLTPSTLDSYPSWSKDGKKIAFTRLGFGISILDLQTGVATNTLYGGDYPSWHPNGHIIAMTSRIGGGNVGYVYNFYRVTVDTLDFRSLYTLTTFDECMFTAVSPRGTTEQEIVMSRTPYNDYTQVWKLNLTTGGWFQLTGDGGDFPAWSPDGTRIVYTRTYTGDGALWIMNADGSGKRRLTSP
jgi:Tol biopolymer transport system component